MNNFRKDNFFLVIVLILLMNLSVLGQAKMWCDLIPLESTRSEVEKLLGKPVSHFETYGLYKNKFGKFSVWFSHGGCSDEIEGRQYDIPAGKMTGLRVILNKFEPLKNYISTKKGFTKEKTKGKFERYFYVSSDESVLFEVITLNDGSEMVSSISIQPGKNKKHLLCSKKNNF